MVDHILKNRKKMNGFKSVLECDPDELIEEYNKTGNVKEIFSQFNINYNSSTQRINFSQLRQAYGVADIHLIFGLHPNKFKSLLLENLDKARNLNELIRLTGVIKQLEIKAISRKVRLKVEDFCNNNNIDIINKFQDGRTQTHLIKGSKKYSDDEVFSCPSPVSHQTIKIRFLKIVEYKCSSCGIDEWLNNPITLHMDHIDGNPRNNKLDNLRLLCPNCHSQTHTFGGKGGKIR